MTEGLKGALHFSPAPENNPGIITKTVDVSLYKEGNSFGFVLRGQCKSHTWGQGVGRSNADSMCVLFCFDEVLDTDIQYIDRWKGRLIDDSFLLLSLKNQGHLVKC